MSLLVMGQTVGGAGSSRVFDSGSIFHICPRRDLFDSFREVSGETVTLADGSTFLVIRVGTVRFQMWDGMIRTLPMFSMYLVYKGVSCHSVSWIHAGMRYKSVVRP
jgi:hypothetical protein